MTVWDLMIGDGKPGFSQSWPDGEEVTTYHRFGSRDGVRPLVLYRSFHGAFPQYVEVDEEFRLYHDLAEDKTRGLLLSFDGSGREIVVVRVTPREVRARLKHLRQFQAGTGLHLAIYIDSVRYSQIPLAPGWTEHPAIKPHLPAEILPRPQQAAPWDYEFTLSNGAVLWVKPGRQKATFRWGVRASKASAEQQA